MAVFAHICVNHYIFVLKSRVSPTNLYKGHYFLKDMRGVPRGGWSLLTRLSPHSRSGIEIMLVIQIGSPLQPCV